MNGTTWGNTMTDRDMGDGGAHIATAAPLGCQLRIWRQLRRMKQSHAAELLGVSQATVSRWESGVEPLDAHKEGRLRDLMQARADSDADRELARLVRHSARPLHLICDLTHRLLALSDARIVESRQSFWTDMIGQSLWPYATEEIVEAEQSLPQLGWFEGGSACLELQTGGNESRVWTIERSRFRIVRMRLSDGSFARLVETLPV